MSKRVRDVAADVLAESQLKPKFTPAAFTPPPDSLTANALARAEMSGSASHPSESTEIGIMGTPYEEWAPNYSEIAAVEDNQGNAVVLMTHSWDGDQFTGARPTAMPPDWGIEMEVILWNDELNGVHPACASNELEEFWGVHDVNSWTVMVPGGQVATYGSYLDWQNLSDECGRNSLTIGIGLPRTLPVTFGTDTIQTMINTDRGTANESVMSSYYQAVSNDCNDIGQDPHTNCMDLNLNRTFPGPGGKVLPVLGKHREWTAPNCIFTTQGTPPADATVDQEPQLIPNGCWWH